MRRIKVSRLGFQALGLTIGLLSASSLGGSTITVDSTQDGLPAGPLVDAFKQSQFDPLVHDHDSNGVFSPGDGLRYDVLITNAGSDPALSLVFQDAVDPNSRLVVGSVVTTQGVVTFGNNPGDTFVTVDIGDLAVGGAGVFIAFEILVDSPVPPGVVQIENQGRIAGSNLLIVLTDDPDTPAVGDPTIDPFFGPVQEIPTLSQWGALAFLLLLGAAALRRLLLA